MQVVRMKVAPDTVAYADAEHHRRIVEFAIPGAPTETIDVKITSSGAASRRAIGVAPRSVPRRSGNV